MSIRLSHVMLLVLAIVMTSPFWIVPFLDLLLVLVKVAMLGAGALVWIVVILSEALGG